MIPWGIPQSIPWVTRLPPVASFPLHGIFGDFSEDSTLIAPTVTAIELNPIKTTDMAKLEITGASPEELEDLREEYRETPQAARGVPFGDAYCLTKIQNQPDDYDGPERFCKTRTMNGRDDYCQFHEHYENLSPTANMTHGVTALRKHLVESFSEAEQEAYHEIREEWVDYYDLEAPGDIDTVESMAVSIIREFRADMVIEGGDGATDTPLTTIRNVFGPEGELVDQEDVPHYLLEERRSIRRLIERCKENLDITRKRRNKHEVEQDKSGQLEAISKSVDEAIEGGEYDPDKYDE